MASVKNEIENPDKFYAWVGKCISAWANIDDELFQIFFECIGALEQCAIIFYRLPGIDAKLKLTDEIVKSRLPRRQKIKTGEHSDASVKNWNNIVSRTGKLLAQRRRIAHQPVKGKRQIIADFDVTPEEITELRHHVIEASAHEALRASSQAEPINLKSLQVHFKEVMALCNDFNKFGSDTLSPLREAWTRLEREEASSRLSELRKLLHFGYRSE